MFCFVYFLLYVLLKNVSLIYGEFAITGEGLQDVYAFVRRSGPLSREESLSCHIYCDRRPRFFRVHLKNSLILLPLVGKIICRPQAGWYDDPRTVLSQYRQADPSPLRSLI
jgi:hypothetical protein